MSAPQNLNFVDPVVVVNQLPVEPGNQVADFGCGSGYFSFEFARRVGVGEGLVHALDVLPSALEAVASRAKTLGLTNIVVKRVNLENEQGSGLAPSSMDWVVLKDVLLQNQKKDVMLREVVRVLKPGGRALIMEWSPDEALVGPEKQLRVDPEALKKLIEAVQLSVETELNVGGFHYGFVVKK
ncbi:MAG: methyltransferase domain-containing protein [Candidatus Moranbacteria bacterium]|nr:methyltransferase domain-containing protein [Candidatus Moranbacteria bacterium]